MKAHDRINHRGATSPPYCYAALVFVMLKQINMAASLKIIVKEHVQSTWEFQKAVMINMEKVQNFKKPQ